MSEHETWQAGKTSIPEEVFGRAVRHPAFAEELLADKITEDGVRKVLDKHGISASDEAVREIHGIANNSDQQRAALEAVAAVGGGSTDYA